MSMKKIHTINRVRFALFFVLSFGFVFSAATAIPTSVSAAEPTTWQKFIQKKCSGSSADGAAQCASSLGERLEDKCGAPKKTDKYTTCWRTFIKSNGGTAGPKSSPFEKEVPVAGGSGAVGCANIKTSLINCDDNGGNPIISLLLQIINFLAVGVGIAVVGGITWGGMMYASSNGDAAKIKQGKTIIVNAVVGLILFFFMYALINFLVPGGLFS